jgi:hypothetical protein
VRGQEPPRRREAYRIADGVALPQVELVGKLAEKYVAMSSLTSEMELVQDLLHEILSLAGLESRRDKNRATGLWIAVVTAYGRCFSTGWRAGYATRGIPSARRFKRWHAELKRHRDKYAAHLDTDADPDWEWGHAVAVLAPAEQRRAIVAVDVDGARMALPEAESLRMTDELVKRVLFRFRMERWLCGQALLERVAGWSLDDVYGRAATGQSLTFPVKPVPQGEFRKSVHAADTIRYLRSRVPWGVMLVEPTPQLGGWGAGVHRIDDPIIGTDVWRADLFEVLDELGVAIEELHNTSAPAVAETGE